MRELECTGAFELPYSTPGNAGDQLVITYVRRGTQEHFVSCLPVSQYADEQRYGAELLKVVDDSLISSVDRECFEWTHRETRYFSRRRVARRDQTPDVCRFRNEHRTKPERDVTLRPNRNSNFQRVLTVSYEGGSLHLLQSRSRPAKRERRRGLTPSAGNG